MNKKGSMLAVGAVSLTLVLAACGGGNDNATAEVTISCGSVGAELEFCREAANEWAEETGNTVRILDTPREASDRLALYQQQLAAQSGDIDVYQIDVVWPGLLGQYFEDLTQYIPEETVAQHFPAIVENNTVDGKLVGMPWFTDAGVLYYRTDLLEKYGFDGPPTTWAELEEQARTIQEGERASNTNFNGFVFQGRNGEGLFCNVVEWVSSFGGSVVNAEGDVGLDSPAARNAVRTAAGWVGTIAPTGVTTYGEEEGRNVFQAGNAAFMRNWPYAYALMQSEGSSVRGKFGVAALPSGEGGRSAATLGGWQLAVSRFSDAKEQAADLVRYLTSREEQKRRAIEGSYNPTLPDLYQDQEVLNASPFFGDLYEVFTNAVARPSTITGGDYNRVSSAVATNVYNVLARRAEPQEALSRAQTQVQELRGDGWAGASQE